MLIAPIPVKTQLTAAKYRFLCPGYLDFFILKFLYTISTLEEITFLNPPVYTSFVVLFILKIAS